MEKLLAGDHPVLELLRQQYAASRVAYRDETGVGVFVTFLVPGDARRLPTNRSFAIRDVSADVDGLQFGVGFILFVRRGFIHCLEAHLWGDGRWPERIENYSLYYTKLIGASVVRATERDWEALTKELEGP
ncbi:MAG: hypothetical protein H5U08_06895 [Thermogutta sp.]|uniref:hypothetical protein n=1 Tax=Thermogutta sp. TaxID=1962930 RepID=UPI001991CFA0|nr:hypothetical protein [Thermogutta sp.]MBC7352069.1 hypothetical protein [Thermogutta sp.]